MPEQENQTSLEAQLLAEIARIERTIAALGAEKAALLRTLTRARHGRLGNFAVTRRNSHTRILAENEILEALRGAPEKTLHTWQLLKVAQTTNPNLKSATLRSHLHRLKTRGLIIAKRGQRGIWSLAPALKT